MIEDKENLCVGLIGNNSRIVTCKKWLTLDFLKPLIFDNSDDGYVEAIYNGFQEKDIIIVCDDTGRLTYKPQNMATARAGIIHGNCVICGIDRMDDGDSDLCAMTEEKLKSAIFQVMKINGRVINSGKELWDYMISI